MDTAVAVKPQPQPEPGPSTKPRSRLDRPIVVLALVGVIAALIRFWGLGYPTRYYFDEVYYAKDACLYLGNTNEQCDLEEDKAQIVPHEQSWVHPPLGKWMIAAGEAIFGYDAFGWRFSSALFGTLTVVIIAAMALLLLRSTLWAFVAGLLMATEHLHVVSSRISMLDVFLTFWVALAFLCVLLDRRWIERRTEAALRREPEPEPPPPSSFGFEPAPHPSPGPGAMSVDEPLPTTDPGPWTTREGWVPSPLWRPWRFAAGVCVGAAGAVKWSGAFALVAVVLLSVFWERSRRKAAGVRSPLLMTIVHEMFGMILAFALVPILVYLVSYTGFFIDRGFSWTEFWDRQTGIYGFHAGDNQLKALKSDGTPSHPYLSAWYTWLLLLRPVAYYFEGPGQEILGVGNPVIFWGSLFALPYGFLRWTIGRDWRAGFAVVAVAVQLLPWVYFSRPQFLFYMAPISPFLVLAVTYACWSWSRTRRDGTMPWTAVVAALVIALSVAVFVFHWPILSAWPLEREAWQMRIWVDCNEALKPFGCGWV